MIEEYEYKIAISPSNIFKTTGEVKTFLTIKSTKEDLKCFLKVCEEEELYEYCMLINDKINEK